MKKLWFRVEVDAEGRVLSTRQCNSEGNGTSRIYFIEARDSGAAEKAALARHLAAKTAERRANYERKGLCRCGLPRDAETKRCSRCLSMQRGHKDRTPPRPRLEVMADRRAVQDEAVRIATLREVRRYARIARDIPKFLEWLDKQLGGAGKAAAE